MSSTDTNGHTENLESGTTLCEVVDDPTLFTSLVASSLAELQLHLGYDSAPPETA